MAQLSVADQRYYLRILVYDRAGPAETKDEAEAEFLGYAEVFLAQIEPLRP